MSEQIEIHAMPDDDSWLYDRYGICVGFVGKGTVTLKDAVYDKRRERRLRASQRTKTEQ